MWQQEPLLDQAPAEAQRPQPTPVPPSPQGVPPPPLLPRRDPRLQPPQAAPCPQEGGGAAVTPLVAGRMQAGEKGAGCGAALGGRAGLLARPQLQAAQDRAAAAAAAAAAGVHHMHRPQQHRPASKATVEMEEEAWEQALESTAVVSLAWREHPESGAQRAMAGLMGAGRQLPELQKIRLFTPLPVCRPNPDPNPQHKPPLTAGPGGQRLPSRPGALAHGGAGGDAGGRGGGRGGRGAGCDPPPQPEGRCACAVLYAMTHAPWGRLHVAPASCRA